MDNSKQKLVMVEDNLIIKESGIPHSPFHIVDENGNVIGSLFHNVESVSYALLFKNAPRMQRTLWDVLENYSVYIKDDNLSDKDLKIIKDISEIQVELLGNTENRTETTWQDELFEKHKDKPLSDVFTDPNQTNIIDEIENQKE